MRRHDRAAEATQTTDTSAGHGRRTTDEDDEPRYVVVDPNAPKQYPVQVKASGWWVGG